MASHFSASGSRSQGNDCPTTSKVRKLNPKDKGKWVCSEHDKDMKFYCQEHDVALCVKCQIAEHEPCRLRILEDVVDENRRTLTRLNDRLMNRVCQDYGPRIEELKTKVGNRVTEERNKVSMAFEEAIKANKDREERDAAKINQEIEKKNRKLRDDIRKIEREIKRNDEERVTRINDIRTISHDKQSAINNEQTELLDSIRNIAEQIVDLEKSWKEITKSHEDATRLFGTVLNNEERLVKEAQRVEDSVSAICVKRFDEGEFDRINRMASHGWFAKAEGRERYLGEIIVNEHTQHSQGWNRVQSIKVTDQIRHPIIVGYIGNGTVIMTDASESRKDTYTFNMASKDVKRVIRGSHDSYVVSCSLLKDDKIACGRFVASAKSRNETGYVTVYDSEWNLVTKISEPWDDCPRPALDRPIDFFWDSEGNPVPKIQEPFPTKVFVAADPNGMIIACKLGQKIIYVINPDSGDIINRIEGTDSMALRGMQSSGHFVAHVASPSDRRVFLIKAETPEDEDELTWLKHCRDVILNVGIDPATDDLYTVTSEDECLTCVIWKLNRDDGDDIDDDDDDDDGNRMVFPLCDRLIELGNRPTRAHIKTRRDHLETSRVILMASNKLIACDGENILVFVK